MCFGLTNGLNNFRFQAGSNDLIGIDKQDPVVGGLLQRKGLLSRKVFKRMLNYPYVVLGQKVLIGAVCAVRIHDDNFVCEGDGFQALLDVPYLVIGDHQGTDTRGFMHTLLHAISALGRVL